MLLLGFGMWCPSFGVCILILNGFCFFLCSIFPDLVESKFDSDSSSFSCGETICVLTWTLCSHTVAYHGDAGSWLCPAFWIWTLVTICFIDSRVCPSMCLSKIYCPSWWSLFVVGRLTLFPSKSSWGIFCSISWLILTSACVPLYGDDVSAMTIFTYNTPYIGIAVWLVAGKVCTQ